MVTYSWKSFDTDVRAKNSHFPLLITSLYYQFYLLYQDIDRITASLYYLISRSKLHTKILPFTCISIVSRAVVAATRCSAKGEDEKKNADEN